MQGSGHGRRTLDCNNEGVLTLRSDVADPTTGNERKRVHAPLCQWALAGSGHVTAAHPRKVRESHGIEATSHSFRRLLIGAPERLLGREAPVRQVGAQSLKPDQ